MTAAEHLASTQNFALVQSRRRLLMQAQTAASVYDSFPAQYAAQMRQLQAQGPFSVPWQSATVTARAPGSVQSLDVDAIASGVGVPSQHDGDYEAFMRGPAAGRNAEHRETIALDEILEGLEKAGPERARLFVK